jgi:Leucine-rich repeat (LRR) protein
MKKIEPLIRISDEIKNLIINLGNEIEYEFKLDKNEFHETFEFNKIGVIVEDNVVTGLNLCNLELDFFPNSIFNFKNLKKLDLSHNNIDQLPSDIEKLLSLDYLDLRFNDLKYLPDSCANLEQLETLLLSNNKLKKLPNSIGNLKNLVKLDLNDNFLSNLPDSFGSLEHLEILALWNNRIEKLPEPFGNLKNLKELNLRENELKNLPESFSHLQSLETLSLNNNKLMNLPESFGTLKVLKHLYLNNNQLSSLPDTMGNLNETLETLYIKGNNFTDIPSIIWPLKKLMNLSLDGESLDEETKELLKGEMNKEKINLILDYCRKRANIRVFISHEMSNFSKYKIEKMANFLENQTEIYYSYFCERDMKKEGDIISFMIDIIPTCQIMICVITEDYKNSKNCNFEIELAQSYGVKIIPILGEKINWDDDFLTKNGLSRDLGFKYGDFNFKNLFKEIYDYILQYKKERNIYAEKYKETLSKIKKNFKKIVKNTKFRAVLKRRLYNVEKIIHDFENNQIDDFEYLNKISEIFSKS